MRPLFYKSIQRLKGQGPVSRKYLSLSRTQFHSTRADPYPIICDLPELSEIEFYSDLSIFEKLGPDVFDEKELT